MTKELDAEGTRAMMLVVANHIIANTDALTDADLAIGDGDHGIGMRRGFEDAREKLSDGVFESPEAVMKAVGMAIMSKTGGAAGAIFGTVFRSGAKALSGKQTMDASALAEFLTAGCDAAAKRGGATPGQKTMLDALVPASKAVSNTEQAGLSSALKAAHAASLEGLEATRDMIATTGKARSLGERSLGHVDPGALSISFILQAMHDHVSKS